MIKYNTDESGYVENWVQLPDVGESQLYDGTLPETWQEDYMYCREVDGVMVLDEEKKAAEELAAAEEDARLLEIEALTAWLAAYDQKVAEYERCIKLGIEVQSISAINAEAIEKQTRLISLTSN